MMLRVPDVLNATQVARVRTLIEAGDWTATNGAAGNGSRQLVDDGKAARAARAIVLDGVGRSSLFFTGALPKKIFPPLFNRYDGKHNQRTSHVDNAVRTWLPTGAAVRSDLAATLFLSDPQDYEGGELVIEDGNGSQRVKLQAGDLMLYGASSVHHVEPVTRGLRMAAFFWVESMVRSEEQRNVLYELDMAIYGLRDRHGESSELMRLTGCYHNLMRLWAST